VDVTAETLDTGRAYRCRLPGGRTIALFFYDGAIARELAFGEALENGERFADRLMDVFGPPSAGVAGADGGAAGDRAARLVHTAVDGETFGHHHPFGDMALAWCLRRIESSGRACLTVYGEFLAAHPPADEVEIVEDTAWSCAHGIERWRADCGCRVGGEEAGGQVWRGPLREAMDALRERLIPIYEEGARGLLPDPWRARDRYIDVILDRSEGNVGRFLEEQAGRALTAEETVAALRLLEMQMHGMLMYTSCGWFFDDIAGLEAVQVMRYAARAMRLAQKVSGVDLEPEFRATLGKAPCNDPEYDNGTAVWDARVRPSRFGPRDVGARFAVSSLFEAEARTEAGLCGWSVRVGEIERLARGGRRLVVGRALFRSIMTRAAFPLRFAALHTGAPDVVGCVVADDDPGADVGPVIEALREPFDRGDVPGVLSGIDAHLGPHGSLVDRIPGDGAGEWLHRLIERRRREVEGDWRRVFDRHRAVRVVSGGRHGAIRPAPPRGVEGDGRGGLPAALSAAMAVACGNRIREEVAADRLDPGRLAACARDARYGAIVTDPDALGRRAGRWLGEEMAAAERSPGEVERLDTIARALPVLHDLPVPLDLWEAQNVGVRMREGMLPGMISRAADDTAAGRWVEAFRRVGALLGLWVGEA
jgi:hypothetical protein